VYRGVLDGLPVAVKLLDPAATGGQQGPKEFQSEVAILSRLHHPHIVLLIGSCPERCALVYELLDYGSLEHHLFNPSMPALAWQVRGGLSSARGLGVCGVVWCGVVWCGVVWCGVVWCGVVWCGVVWCGVRWYRGCAFWLLACSVGASVHMCYYVLNANLQLCSAVVGLGGLQPLVVSLFRRTVCAWLVR
jgi:hypothetical protein